MRARCAYLLGVFLLCFASAAHLSAGDLSRAKADRIAIQRDKETLKTQILIEAQGGRISWEDVLIGLARAKKYDDTAFTDLLSDHSVDLHSRRVRLGIGLANLSLPKGVDIRVLAAEKIDEEPRLSITLDRAALLTSKRKFQKMIRSTALRLMSPMAAREAGHGVQLPDDWRDTPLDKPLVLIVPGFQSNRANTDRLVEAFRSKGFLAGGFHYPNDQPLEDSAELLAGELRKLAKAQPGRRIRIVAYSMGGLVTRRVIEDPDLDSQNVVQLIMVGTPNQGSKLAAFGHALELWEHLVETDESDYFRKLYASIEDGLGEAADDLEPDSPFLKALNARPRNARVRYSLFLGTGAALTEKSLKQLREQYAKAASSNRLLRFFGPRMDALLADLDEVVSGKGDGAVAVTRGKLEGVEDVVILDFNHIALSGAPEGPRLRRLQFEIVARLNAGIP